MGSPDPNGPNAAYVAQLLEEYLDAPASVPPEWRRLFGEADELYCHTHRVQQGIRGEDAATIMLRMGGKTTVTCSIGFPGHFLEHDVFTQTLILVEGDAGSAPGARRATARGPSSREAREARGRTRNRSSCTS